MADSDAGPTSAVRALRNTFGDPKPPDISRKITACVACRKQKIKCHMRDANPPCTRCKKRGLSCVVNRSLQMLLESDVVWKHSLENKVQRLQDAIKLIASHSNLPSEVVQGLQLDEIGHLQDPSLVREDAGDESQQEPHPFVSPSSSATHDHPVQQVNHWEIVMDLDSGPGDIPGFYMSQTPQTEPSAGTSPQTHLDDIVTRGIITLDAAQLYFSEYQNRLDHFPYRVLGDYTNASLSRIREASSLLTAAVCTVGALHCHSPSSDRDFASCYQAFTAMAAAQSFAKDCTVDKVRALCIGAFWLGDLSWPLVASAVRMATELQLHKCMGRALAGDRAAYLRTRLYLLVYTCDHHFSVAFGRPPLTRECETIRTVRRFLSCRHATEDDSRLVSQVLRWSLCSNVFDTFGAHSDRPLKDAEVPHLRRFSIALDSLRAEWADKFQPSAHVGNYPRKGVGLQYHFARLYLCSHAFRGAGRHDASAANIEGSSAATRSHDIAMELEEVANSAVFSAMSIVRNVVSDPEMQSHLDGLPIYFDTMIAFAVVFLLKVSTNEFSEFGRPDMKEIQNLLEQLIVVLKRVTSAMHPQHLLVRITKGVDGLLKRSLEKSSGPSSKSAAPVTRSQSQGQALQQTDLGVDPSAISESQGQGDVLEGGNWTVGAIDSLDPWFMGEYDFLLDQNMGFPMADGLLEGGFAEAEDTIVVNPDS